VEFDSEKVGSSNHTQLKFQETEHVPCPGRVCGVINDKSLQLKFSKQRLWFLD